MQNKKLEQSYIPFQCMIMNHVDRFRIEGVPSAQYYILEVLEREGSKTTNELAELRGITQSGMSKLTKRLLDKEYIVQQRNEADRRIYDISITEAGKAFLQRSEKFRNELLHKILKALSEEEANQFAALCNKITMYDKEQDLLSAGLQKE